MTSLCPAGRGGCIGRRRGHLSAGRERRGDVLRGVVAVLDDVDLLAAQLLHDVVHALAAGTDRSVIEKSLADYARLIAEGHGDEDISALIRLKRKPRET